MTVLYDSRACLPSILLANIIKIIELHRPKSFCLIFKTIFLTADSKTSIVVGAAGSFGNCHRFITTSSPEAIFNPEINTKAKPISSLHLLCFSWLLMSLPGTECLLGSLSLCSHHTSKILTEPFPAITTQSNNSKVSLYISTKQWLTSLSMTFIFTILAAFENTHSGKK